MKELVKLQQVHYEIVDQTIFEDINVSIQTGDIIGVIGKNGAGKSTLLQLITGALLPTKGNVKSIEMNLTTVFVEQETESHAPKEVTTRESTLLHKWHVPDHVYARLSGGEKLKARLAHGFAEEADLLLMDEPTNHLDQQSTTLLIEEIVKYKGTIILVSHDRYFLDAVTTKIWSIEDKKLIEHKGNYSSYMAFREQKRLTQQHEYTKQQKNVERIENQMKELTSWSSKAHAQSTKKEGYKEHYRVKAKRMDKQIKSKQKRLDKELEKAKVEQVKPEYDVQFSIRANTKVGKRFLEVKGLTKRFSDQTLFKDVTFTIQHGEKVGLIGPNGSGKTTFLKILVGDELSEGEVWLSPAATIGYLTQEVFDLPLENTPEQLFFKETFEARGKVQNLMQHLGFTSSQWREPILHMSMGERVKCKLMVYILEEKDVLILDEPTNHLDLPSREQLENTLADYNGTLLVVSHDSYFLDKTTNEQLLFSNESIVKQSKEASNRQESEPDKLRLTLETERQEVLGKLSFMTPKDSGYPELDEKFNQLTKQINNLL
ncbi:ribosomal protection-like ABC-F family protein [Paraliobacillus sediminis]|uniref:ribosomal protection-like ABC-F family protein n=1 Tax=Paraliobacillus sediminis TaxID=1885916 RepID=UPI000E3B5E44|nr:ABC-F type ribosomal protection protein [Paraliobacillus sediminis]